MGRNYSSIAKELTVGSGGITSSSPTVSVEGDVSSLPAVPFTLVIDPDSVNEEIVTVTLVSGAILTITRGEEGTLPRAHADGTLIRHMITGRDLQEPQDHISNVTNPHGITNVATLTYTNEPQTLTNKRLNSPKINEEVALSATATELNILDGATVTTTEVNRLSGVTSAVQTQLNNKPGIKVSGTDASGRTISVQNTAPTSPQIGDIWFQVTGL